MYFIQMKSYIFEATYLFCCGHASKFRLFLVKKHGEDRLAASCQLFQFVVTCQQVATNLSISSSSNNSVKITIVAICRFGRTS